MDTVLEKKTEKLAEPPRYAVVIHNDDFTPFEWVVYVICDVLKIPMDDAWIIADQVHKTGKGIAGSFTKDIAETKVNTINELSRKNEHPLLVTAEKI